MLERVLRFSIDRRWLVVVVTLAAAAVGVRSLLVLPIDAVPDITNRQVQVNATAPALSPAEVVARIGAIGCYASQVKPMFRDDRRMAAAVGRHVRRAGGERIWRRRGAGGGKES